MPAITRAELRTALTGFEHTAFRLELLPFYAEDAESDALQAFADGREPDVYPGKQRWQEAVRAAASGGRIMQRVHVVSEPLSVYLRFEIGWSYPLNHEAGEDIRILRREHAPTAVTSAGDYWLLDSRTLIRMLYNGGELAAIDHVTDPDIIVAAGYGRDAALHHAVPLTQYLTAQGPQLQHAS